MEITVEELRTLIADAPGETIVVTFGEDHSYRRVDNWCFTTGLFSESEITEDYGEEMTPEADYGKRTPVLLLS